MVSCVEMKCRRLFNNGELMQRLLSVGIVLQVWNWNVIRLQICVDIILKCLYNIVENLKLVSVMGNLGNPLNFPLVWTRNGAVEPRCSNWYCAARGYLLIGQSGAYGLGAQRVEW